MPVPTKTAYFIYIIVVFFIAFSECAPKTGGKNKKGKRENVSYIKVSSSGQLYNLTASKDCWGGGWIPDPIPIDCICVRGIWAVSTGLCDANTTIYTGDGHCYKINQRIRKIFNIDVDKRRPFTPANILVNSIGTEFLRIKNSYRIGPHEEYTYLFRVNSKHPMFSKTYDAFSETYGDPRCSPSIRREFQSNKTSKYIYISDISGKNHFNLGSPGICPISSMENFWTLTVGQSFRLSDQQITEGKVGKPEHCLPSRVLPKAKNKLPDVFYTSQKLTPGQEAEGKNASVRFLTKDIDDTQYDEFEFRSKALVSPDDYNFDDANKWGVEDDDEGVAELVKIQTRRLGHYYEHFTFNHRSGPKVKNVKEMAYLQMARKIMIKTCSSPYVNALIINHLFRWFRWIWRESLEVFPYMEVTEAEQHERIMKALTKCYDEADNHTINYRTDCGPVVIESVVNRQAEYREVLPDNMRYDTAKLEASLEFIWKLMVNVHYYCAEYFLSNPTDHSALNVRFDAVFSPMIRKRWENPGNSFELMRSLWSSYELIPLFQAIDACVAASTAISQYPEFIKRPIDSGPLINPLKKEKSKSNNRTKRAVFPQQRSLWNQLGYCLVDNRLVKHKYSVDEKECENGNSLF